MRTRILGVFELLADIVTTLLEPFQFATRKRQHELELERQRTEAMRLQVEMVLEHSATINADTSKAMLEVAKGFQVWMELFKTQGNPEAHTHTQEDQWREEQIKLREGYIAGGLNIPRDPEAALKWAASKVDEDPAGEGSPQFSPTTQAYLDSLYEMRRAG